MSALQGRSYSEVHCYNDMQRLPILKPEAALQTHMVVRDHPPRSTTTAVAKAPNPHSIINALNRVPPCADNVHSTLRSGAVLPMSQTPWMDEAHNRPAPLRRWLQRNSARQNDRTIQIASVCP